MGKVSLMWTMYGLSIAGAMSGAFFSADSVSNDGRALQFWLAILFATAFVVALFFVLRDLVRDYRRRAIKLEEHFEHFKRLYKTTMEHVRKNAVAAQETHQDVGKVVLEVVERHKFEYKDLYRNLFGKEYEESE